MAKENHESFKVTQTLVLFNEKNQVLVMKHKAEKWLLLGGRLNKDESWEQGLRREVEEETGIKNFDIESIVKVDNWIDRGTPHYGVFFKGRTIENKVVPSNEMIDYSWADVENIDSYDMWVDDLKDTVRKVAKDKK